jgi:hypothetical protein
MGALVANVVGLAFAIFHKGAIHKEIEEARDQEELARQTFCEEGTDELQKGEIVNRKMERVLREYTFAQNVLMGL